MRTVSVAAAFVAILGLEHAARAEQPPGPAAPAPTRPPAQPAPTPPPAVSVTRQPLILHADLDVMYSVTEDTADGEQSAAGLRLGFPIGRYLVIEGQVSMDLPSLFSQDTGSSTWAGLRLHLPTTVAPYVFARAGYHTHDHYEPCGVFDDRCDPNPVAVTHEASVRELGGGLETRLGHFRAFVESGYGREGLSFTLGLGAGF